VLKRILAYIWGLPCSSNIYIANPVIGRIFSAGLSPEEEPPKTILPVEGDSRWASLVL
jgi:hypothetical protein